MFPRRVQPLWTLQFNGAPAIARLGFLEGASRSVLSVAVPLEAFEVLGSARRVSVTYTIGACLALIVTLSAANLERLVARRWVTTLGIGSTIAASTVFIVADGPVFALGIAASAAGASLFSTTLSLYIMENIGTDGLARSESKRLLWAGAAWFTGPLLGVLLREHVAHFAPYVFSMALASMAAGYFWVLRLGSNHVVTAAAHHPASPLRTVPRYFGQRYMRVAYAITVVRATMWVSIFLYGSVYVVDAGLPVWVSGAFLSGAAALLFMAPLVGALAATHSTRSVVAVAFGVIAGGLALVAALPSPQRIGLLGWGFAALGASALDVVGNLPFMRTVKRRDRVAMTGVFSTWRDTSTMAAPAMAAAVLSVGSIRAFYLSLAVLAALTASTSSLIPRRI